MLIVIIMRTHHTTDAALSDKNALSSFVYEWFLLLAYFTDQSTNNRGTGNISTLLKLPPEQLLQININNALKSAKQKPERKVLSKNLINTKTH